MTAVIKLSRKDIIPIFLIVVAVLVGYHEMFFGADFFVLFS
jgi:preprotein translocase subunit SecE